MNGFTYIFFMMMGIVGWGMVSNPTKDIDFTHPGIILPILIPLILHFMTEAYKNPWDKRNKQIVSEVWSLEFDLKCKNRDIENLERELAFEEHDMKVYEKKTKEMEE